MLILYARSEVYPTPGELHACARLVKPHFSPLSLLGRGDKMGLYPLDINILLVTLTGTGAKMRAACGLRASLGQVTKF